MTEVTAVRAGPACTAGPASPPGRRQHQVPSDQIGVPVNMTASLSSVPAVDRTELGPLASPPGVVAGTALKAARLSARLTRSELGEATGTDEAAIAAWEDGAEPLAAVPYPVFGRLEAALTGSAEPGLVTDLTTAAWCDLVIAAVADAQDVSCLMADPTAAEDAFSELLAWSVGGHRPARYHPFIGPGPLLQPADIGLIGSTIRELGQTQRFLRPYAA
ncbi:MAG TPA: helix-turn-helix transcriptional regulator [Streptosporangiaceae bacterium]|nr:helix-turn-helix transcriptional regulator [Streptosporangiaceae bacterium]